MAILPLKVSVHRVAGKDAALVLEATTAIEGNECANHDLNVVTKINYGHPHKVLGMIVVPHALLYVCTECGREFRTPEARQNWELDHATKLLLDGAHRFTREEVRFLRELLGQTQEEFSLSLGITVDIVERWESDSIPLGSNSILRNGALLLIAAGLMQRRAERKANWRRALHIFESVSKKARKPRAF